MYKQMKQSALHPLKHLKMYVKIDLELQAGDIMQ